MTDWSKMTEMWHWALYPNISTLSKSCFGTNWPLNLNSAHWEQDKNIYLPTENGLLSAYRRLVWQNWLQKLNQWERWRNVSRYQVQEGRPKRDDSDVLVGAMEKLVQHSHCDSERKRRKNIIQKTQKLPRPWQSKGDCSRNLVVCTNATLQTFLPKC